MLHKWHPIDGRPGIETFGEENKRQNPEKLFLRILCGSWSCAPSCIYRRRMVLLLSAWGRRGEGWEECKRSDYTRTGFPTTNRLVIINHLKQSQPFRFQTNMKTTQRILPSCCHEKSWNLEFWTIWSKTFLMNPLFCLFLYVCASDYRAHLFVCDDW